MSECIDIENEDVQKMCDVTTAQQEMLHVDDSFRYNETKTIMTNQYNELLTLSQNVNQTNNYLNHITHYIFFIIVIVIVFYIIRYLFNIVKNWVLGW